MSKDQAKASIAETDEAVKVEGKKAKKPKGKATAKPAVFKSVHADEPKREVVWSERRVAVVKAMRKLGAVSATTAVTASAIAKAAGIPEDEVFRVKVVLDVYRVTELVHNGFAKSVRPEGSRELAYYLTPKGKATDFPVKE